MCSIFVDAYKQGKWNVWDTMQNNIFFQASTTPDDYKYKFRGQQNFHEVFWKDPQNEDNQLHGIHFLVSKYSHSPKGVVLCFHGNAGTIAQWGELSNMFTMRGFDILMIDYRTFGKSKGDLSEAVLHADALIAYKYLCRFYKAKKQIYIHGISIGTAIATRLASQVPCRALILQTPFSNLKDVEQAHVRIPEFVCRLLKFQFESDKFITAVKCPIFGIHSKDDTLIPCALAVKLFNQVKDRKNCVLWLIDNAGHSVETSSFYSLFLDTIYSC